MIDRDSAVEISRNPNPWKPLAAVGDLFLENVHGNQTLPNTEADSRAHFKHELNQLLRPEPPEPDEPDDGDGGGEPSVEWHTIPFHSLGSLNSSFGRQLTPADLPNGANSTPAPPMLPFL